MSAGTGDASNQNAYNHDVPVKDMVKKQRVEENNFSKIEVGEGSPGRGAFRNRNKKEVFSVPKPSKH